MIPLNHQYIQKLAKELRKEGIKIKMMKSFHYSAPYNFIATLLLKPFGYKIIHIHWIYVFPFSFLMKLYIKLAKLIGYKIVWTVHNVHPHENFENNEKTRWFAKNVDYFFIHYNSNVKKLEDYIQCPIEKNKIKIIFHPSFEDIYTNKLTQEEARDMLDIPKDKKVILCFGQIRRYKGIDLFQQAMNSLTEEYFGLIVGEIKDKELFKEINSKLEIPNLQIVPKRIKNEDIQIYLNASDVVITLYTDITTSGITLLAYSFSKPILSTRVGCMSEILVEGKTGFFIADRTPLAVKNSIIQLFKEDYKKMGKDSYMFSKKFSWTLLIDSIIQGYGEVLNE